MKITLLTEQFAPDKGGIQNYLRNVAEGLASKHDVMVVAPTVTTETGEANQAISYRLERRRFHWPLLKPSWLLTLISLWRRAKREEIDVLLCGKALFEGLGGYYLKKRLGIPYVIFTYAMEVEEWASRAGTRRKLERVLMEASHIVYINDVTKKRLLELGATEAQLVKVTPGIDGRYFNDVAPELAASTARHYGVKQPYILSAGRLIRRKGFDTLIRGFAELDQTKFASVQLVIVGVGDDLDYLQALAKEQLAETSVKFLTDVPDKHMPALYAGAQAFALTPRVVDADTEGFGIVYLEAAALGKPSLGTQTGGVSEAVLENETGLIVAEEDPSAVTDALTKLLTDDELRQRLGKKARERADWEFRWSERHKQMNELLSNLKVS